MSWTDVMDTNKKVNITRAFWMDYIHYIQQQHKAKKIPASFWFWYQNIRPLSSVSTNAS
jgi:hypothetical protein